MGYFTFGSALNVQKLGIPSETSYICRVQVRYGCGERLTVCRFVAYLGEEIKLEELVYNFPHNLVVQSYAPKELLVGNVNLDGFGCGWYNTAVEKDPALYATLLPIWADYRFPTIAKAVASNIIFSSVRNATPPFPNELSSVLPLALGKYLFLHNGYITDYNKCKRRLENELPDEYFNMIQSRSDSAFIFAAFMWKLSEIDVSEKLIKKAMIATLDWLKNQLESLGEKANLNIGIADGESMLFIRHEFNGACNSLYYNESHEQLSKGVLIASEPLDEDNGWNEVPENSMIEVKLGKEIKLSELE